MALSLLDQYKCILGNKEVKHGGYLFLIKLLLFCFPLGVASSFPSLSSCANFHTSYL